jgi:hypothetical protein
MFACQGVVWGKGTQRSNSRSPRDRLLARAADGCPLRPAPILLRFARLQDDIYRPNYYQSLMEFREQTLQRLKKFVAQKFFSVRDYNSGEVVHARLPASSGSHRAMLEAL